jgi:hypothetical protein
MTNGYTEGSGEVPASLATALAGVTGVTGTGTKVVTDVGGALVNPHITSDLLTEIADDFVPTTTGLAGDVGAVCYTADGSKAWKRWGTDVAGKQWGALHAVKTITGAESSTLDIPLNCDVLGGFRISIAGLGSTAATTDSPHFVARVNGADYGATHTQRLSWNDNDMYPLISDNLAGGTIVWVNNTDVVFVDIECVLAHSSVGARLIRFKAVQHLGSQAYANQLISNILEVEVPAAVGEIVSVGLKLHSTSGNAKMPVGAAYLIEQRIPW